MSEAIESLMAAMHESQAAYFARNAFHLSQSSLGADISDADVLRQFEPVLSAEQLGVLKSFLDARKAAYEVVRQLSSQRAQAVAERAQRALETHAHALGDGWYAFEDDDTSGTVKAKVLGFESCYTTRDGGIAGVLRIRQRSGSETWSFWLKNGRIVVRTEPDLY